MSSESSNEVVENFFAEQVLHKVWKYIRTNNYVKIKKRVIKIPSLDINGSETAREKLITPKILKINAYPDYILVEKNDKIIDDDYKFIFDVKLGYRSYSIHMLVGVNRKNLEIDIIDAELIGRIR